MLPVSLPCEKDWPTTHRSVATIVDDNLLVGNHRVRRGSDRSQDSIIRCNVRRVGKFCLHRAARRCELSSSRSNDLPSWLGCATDSQSEINIGLSSEPEGSSVTMRSKPIPAVGRHAVVSFRHGSSFASGIEIGRLRCSVYDDQLRVIAHLGRTVRICWRRRGTREMYFDWIPGQLACRAVWCAILHCVDTRAVCRIGTP